MRLFAKKNSARSSNTIAGTNQGTKTLNQVAEDESLRANFEKLFSDNHEETYVESQSIMRAAKKENILQHSSPISIPRPTRNENVKGPALNRADAEHADGLDLVRGKQTPASSSSLVTPMFQGSSHKKPPMFGQKKDLLLHSSPISLLESPPHCIEATLAHMDDSFEPAEGDDDIFMVEEATHRDFNNATDVRRGLDLDEELIRTSATFKWGELKESASVEMSAEDILSSHHMNLSKRPPPIVNRPPGLPNRPPVLSNRPPALPMRPPPLIESDTPTPQSATATVFGHDGGFSTGGFTITSAGMVSQPDFAVREDLEVQTLSADDFKRGPVLMKDLKEFRRGPTIGAGAAGRVYLALHEPTQIAVAMKTVNVYDSPKRVQLLKELQTLSMHVSRYLVRFYGAFYDGSGVVHIALEFMDRGCLASFVKKFGAIPERVVQIIAMDCLRGLRFLHKQRVLHRDFKTANILLSRTHCCAKVSDFGLARDLNPGKSLADTFVGTVAYMSPERLQGSDYTYASDIWALGISLVECFLGRYPFDRPQNFFDYIEATMTRNLLDGPEMTNISEDAKSFVALCTDTDPQKRPTAVQLLEHAWLKDYKRDKAAFGGWMDECSSKSISMPSKT